MERVRINKDDKLQFIRKVPLAKRLGINPWTLLGWCKKGRFPKPIKFTERTLVWRVSDVEDWIARQPVATWKGAANG